MKMIAALTVTFMMAIAALPAAAQTDGLVSCWSMDETSGVRADKWGTNHLTDINTVGASAGVYGSASTYVSANSERLEVADNISFDGRSFTYAYWISYQLDSGSRPYYKPGEYQLDANPAGGWFRMYNHSTHVSTYETIPLQTWHHLLTRYDAAAQTTELFINGSSVISGTLANSPNVANALQVGYTMNGSIDEMAFYDVAVSDSTVAYLYNDGAGVSCDQLIAGAVAVTPDTHPVDLPSGGVGELIMSITAGEAAIALGLGALITLAAYALFRDMARRAKAR